MQLDSETGARLATGTARYTCGPGVIHLWIEGVGEAGFSSIEFGMVTDSLPRRLPVVARNLLGFEGMVPGWRSVSGAYMYGFAAPARFWSPMSGELTIVELSADRLAGSLVLELVEDIEPDPAKPRRLIRGEFHAIRDTVREASLYRVTGPGQPGCPTDNP